MTRERMITRSMSARERRLPAAAGKCEGGEYDGGRDAQGRKHGVGRMRYANGDCYSGAWSGGKRHGIGRYTKPSGEMVEGRFVAGLPECPRHPVGARATRASCWCMHAPIEALHAMVRTADDVRTMRIHAKQLHWTLRDMDRHPHRVRLHEQLRAGGAAATLQHALAVAAALTLTSWGECAAAERAAAASLHRHAAAALQFLRRK
jgi:hypothetical protein